MPVILSEPQVANYSMPHKLWTRDECALAQSAGVDLSRYELIEGELVPKVSKNYPHMRALVLLVNWFRTFMGGEIVLQEPSIYVSPVDSRKNEPEPDLVILKRSLIEIGSKPRPEDIEMAAEVSDSTVAFDLSTKARLYARAGIIEYWVLDINGRRMVVHRDPQEGLYHSIVEYNEDEFVSCLAAPEQQIRVSELL